MQGEGLSVITCRKRAGEYTVGIANNTWREQPFRLESLCGKMESLRELPLDTVGGGRPRADTRGGGRVEARQEHGEHDRGGRCPHLCREGPGDAGSRKSSTRPRRRAHAGRLLPLRRATSIKEEILARPTFFEHFDGVCVDWSYLHEREKAALPKGTRLA